MPQYFLHFLVHIYSGLMPYHDEKMAVGLIVANHEEVSLVLEE